MFLRSKKNLGSCRVIRLQHQDAKDLLTLFREPDTAGG
jgi:hypothetical protein